MIRMFNAHLHPILMAPADTVPPGPVVVDPPVVDPPPAVTFTQDQLDAVVKKRVREAAQTKADLAAAHETIAAQEDYRAQLEELKAKSADQGKTDLEKLTAKHERELSALTKGAETAAGELKAAQDASAASALGLRDQIIRAFVADGFAAAKVHGPAAKDAINVFMATAKIEMNEDNTLESIELGDGAFSDPKLAAAAFLAERPHFAAASGGGSGASTRSGVPMVAGKTVDDLSPAELLALADAQRKS